jgi:hypothetical protein
VHEEMMPAKAKRKEQAKDNFIIFIKHHRDFSKYLLRFLVTAGYTFQ